jgi:hypothetical protein
MNPRLHNLLYFTIIFLSGDLNLYDPSKKTQKSLDSVMNLTSKNGKKPLFSFNI